MNPTEPMSNEHIVVLTEILEELDVKYRTVEDVLKRDPSELALYVAIVGYLDKNG